MEIILGSQSPRRHELLSGMGIPFRVVNIHADESFPSNLKGADIPLYISRAKAEAFRSQLQPGQLLITADTIVWVDGMQLGKPIDEEDAKRMIGMLSGKTHQVFTGVTLTSLEKQTSFTDTTDVTFRAISPDEIEHYVHCYRPLDKAGAYGIQEWIGYVACTGLKGSFFNVVGLPTEKLHEALQAF